MKIIKEFFSGEIKYDSIKDKHRILMLEIDKSLMLEINFIDIIESQYTLGNLDKAQLSSIKMFLNIGEYYKAPCGGYVNFYEYEKKGLKYIIYSGVNEVSNSYYIVTLHKIIKEDYNKP